MAQSVSIVISSTTPRVDISITENSRNLFAYVGSGNGLVFIPSQTSLDLTQAASTVAIQTETAGISGQFTYAQIGTFTIDGVDQLATATNLSLVIDACAPFFFEAPNEITVPVEVDGAINYIDLKWSRAPIVRVTNGSNATISEIRNVPVGHQFHVFPDNFDLSITKTAFASITDWKIGGAITGVTLQFNVGETAFFVGKQKPSAGARYAALIIANVSFF